MYDRILVKERIIYFAVTKINVCRDHIHRDVRTHQEESVDMILSCPVLQYIGNERFVGRIREIESHYDFDSGSVKRFDHGLELAHRIAVRIGCFRHVITARGKSPVIDPWCIIGRIGFVIDRIHRFGCALPCYLVKFIAGHQNDLVDSQILQMRDLLDDTGKLPAATDLR